MESNSNTFSGADLNQIVKKAHEVIDGGGVILFPTDTIWGIGCDVRQVAAIEKITIADTDHLADSWFKTEILDGLKGADIEFIDPSTNDGEYGIVSVHLTTPTGSVVLD